VAVHTGPLALEDDLRLGTVYQRVGEKDVPVMQLPGWSMNGVRGAKQIVMQVFKGAIVFRVD
jgi:hypothetical protein